MGLIGSLMKDSTVGVIIPVISTLAIGCFTIYMINSFIGSAIVYWIVDFILFGLMLLTVAIDTKSVKDVAESIGFTNNTNLAIYCAYMLYVEFIWIFLRVLLYTMMFSRRK